MELPGSLLIDADLYRYLHRIFRTDIFCKALVKEIQSMPRIKDALFPLRKRSRYLLFCAVMLAVLFVLLILAAGLGSVSLPFETIRSIIVNTVMKKEVYPVTWEESAETILLGIRIPRILTAFIVGAGLTLCGILMQALTKNPLADPYVLGISHGASAGAVSVIMYGYLKFLGGYGTMVGAFCGAVISIALALKIAAIRNKVTATQLVLAGIAVSALFGAITNFMIYHTKTGSDKVKTATYWMMGSLSGASWEKLKYATIAFVICLILILFLSKGLDVLLLGDDVAVTVGVNTERLKMGIIILATLLTGVIVMSVLSVISLLLAFAGTKERVKTEPQKHEKGAASKALKLIFRNKAMLSISVVAMLLLAGQMFTQSYYIYLIRYYFGKGGIFVSLPTILTYIPMAILMLFTPKLARKFGKKEITSVGMIIAAAANFLMFFLKFLDPGAALMPFMVLCLISGFGLNLFVLQLWAMAGDAIDEIEVSTGSKDNGTAYAFLNFFRKLGQVISAIAVNAALLAMGYYDTASTLEFVFSEGQLDLMYVLATLIPAVMFALMAIALLFWYPLSKEKVGELQNRKEDYLKEQVR